MSETLAGQENYFSLVARRWVGGIVLGEVPPARESSCKGFQFSSFKSNGGAGRVGLSLSQISYFLIGPALLIVAVFQVVG